MAVMGYVDVTPELGRGMSKLLIETDDPESDFDDKVRLRARAPLYRLRRALGVRAPHLLGIDDIRFLLFPFTG